MEFVKYPCVVYTGTGTSIQYGQSLSCMLNIDRVLISLQDSKFLGCQWCIFFTYLLTYLTSPCPGGHMGR